MTKAQMSWELDHVNTPQL